MKNKLQKNRYSTTFGVDPAFFIVPLLGYSSRLGSFLNGGSSRTRICDPLRVMQEMFIHIQ